jgi:hypothetical protein
MVNLEQQVTPVERPTSRTSSESPEGHKQREVHVSSRRKSGAAGVSNNRRHDGQNTPDAEPSAMREEAP